jgi:hypothetical protein
VSAVQQPRYLMAGADLSPCGKYRYRLWREWRGSAVDANWHWWTNEDGSPALDGAGHQIGEPKACVFVMLNPSTADGAADDQTIRKCVAFAKLWGYDRLDVLNLFAYRATDPATLILLHDDMDPLGPLNLDAFKTIFGRRETVGRIVCAWGANGAHLGQDQTALGWMHGHETLALGLTKDGLPRHPLYLPLNSPLIRFGAPRR